MRTLCLTLCVALSTVANSQVSFISPDTVCVNAPVPITNTSASASTYYWNFCVANVTTPPQGQNLGNVGSQLSAPVYIDYAFDNGNYYAFQINNFPGKLLRLDFGSSLLNTPTVTSLGTVGGVIPNNTEGIQVIKNEGKWYLIIVGGYPAGGSASAIVKIELGTNIANNSPVGTNWGNIGTMNYPHDLYVFDDNGHWYGLTVNSENNTITRFDFTTSFSNTPTALNIGNIGNLLGPTGIYAVKEGTNWYAFVTNANSNSITRLNFGSSLLNFPTGTNLGNVGSVLAKPWDLQIMRFCGQTLGFLINAETAELLKLDFNGSILNTPTVSSYGNVGNMSFPHCLSRLFRAGPDLYTFVCNVNNNTLSRIRFVGCNNASIPNSSLQNPPSVSYATPGVYNINLTTDESLPTQGSFCRQVVVVAPPSKIAIADETICPGGSVSLNTNFPGANYFSWSPAGGLSNTTVSNPLASPSATTEYIVTASSAIGCSVKDTVTVSVLTAQQCQQAVTSFTAPDTVCVNTPINITNTSSGVSSNYWNFCVANVDATPQGNNLGNVGGALTLPVYVDYVQDNGNYYGFLVNNFPGGLVRLNFGNSLLNTPTVTNLGTVGGVIPQNAEGVQVVKNEGKWYVIVVGGYPDGGSPSAIVKVELGTNIANNSPVGTNWGNLGNMNYPHDLYVFDDNGHWYGLTVNYSNNTITRFDFTTSFSNFPTAVNLGNVGNLSGPVGIYAIKENNLWYAFITNSLSNSLTRLSFGASLLSAPTGTNIGNIAGNFSKPWDIQIVKYCGKTLGFLINAESATLVKLDFNGSVLNTPSLLSYGNIGGFNFPHCLSKLFRSGDDLYTFVCNVNNNTLTRVRFTGCTNATVPNSTLFNPPTFSYNVPGVYNVNLTTDDGLPTQASFCKQIVVLAPPTITPLIDQTICPGGSVGLLSSISGAVTISWSPTAGLSNPSIANPVASPSVTTDYVLTASNSFGCSAKDTVRVNVLTPQQCGTTTVAASFTAADTVCVNQSVTPINTSVNATTYAWNFCTADVNIPPTGTSLGNPGGALTTPCFVDYAYDNGNYFGLVISNNPASLVRLNFGNSLLNTPTATNFGNFGNIIPFGAQGIQLVNDNNNWVAVIVGGDPLAGGSSRILKVEFGSSLSNNSPVATNWGNIGSLNYPHDLFVFRDQGIYYGFTVNYLDGTATRFVFGSSFANSPTGTNLGSLGGMNKPSGICPVNDNGIWRVFVANFGNNTLTRLDFGSSLTSVPSATNLGTLGGKLSAPRDLYIFNYCNQQIGFLVNDATNDVVRLNFNSLTSTPTATSLGSIGGTTNPHSISKLFRVGGDLFAFIPNSYINTITRLQFPSCNQSSSSFSSAQNPPPITYSTPGTYNITLTVDEGLITQTAFCKKVVVLPPVSHQPTQQFSICQGASIKFGRSVTSASYLWSSGASTDSISTSSAGLYWVEISRFGCTTRDSFNVSLIPPQNPDFSFVRNSCTPKSLQLISAVGAGNQSVKWIIDNTDQPLTSNNPTVNFAGFGDHTIKLVSLANTGCSDSVQKVFSLDSLFDATLFGVHDTIICLGDSVSLSTTQTTLNSCLVTGQGTSLDPNVKFIKPQQKTVVRITSISLGTNQISNFDFSGGSTGVQSDYQLASSNSSSGQFSIGNNPQAWNNILSPCTDHTGSNGAMMMVNGSTAAGKKVWYQTFAVLPNTNYAFNFWTLNLQAVNPASLNVLLDGQVMISGIVNTAGPCGWSQQSLLWNSGSKTSVQVALTNTNLSATGNDFALDDLFFGRLYLKSDSLRVNVSKGCDWVKIAGTSTVCSIADAIDYTISKPVECELSYQPAVNADSVEVISQTTSTLRLRFKKGGSVRVKVLINSPCGIVADSMLVNVKLSPSSISLGPDINICRDTAMVLHAGPGFASYQWQNNSADSTLAVSIPGMYFIKATNYCNQVFSDTLILKTSTSQFAAVANSQSACVSDSITLQASGGTSYTWSPAPNFASPTAATTRAIVRMSEIFSVTIHDGNCLRDSVFLIPVQTKPLPDVKAIKSNDVDCAMDSAVLTASGAATYNWSPSNFVLRNQGTRLVVKPNQNITYVVVGTGSNGCKNLDSVRVSYASTGDQKLHVPTAFTPNGDGLNDLYHPIMIGGAAEYDFRIYNRWGQLLFRTNDPNKGWDGRHNSTMQPNDVYVFYVTAKGGCNGEFRYKGTFALIR